jgi:hypothetical protein
MVDEQLNGISTCHGSLRCEKIQMPHLSEETTFYCNLTKARYINYKCLKNPVQRFIRRSRWVPFTESGMNATMDARPPSLRLSLLEDALLGRTSQSTLGVGHLRGLGPLDSHCLILTFSQRTSRDFAVVADCEVTPGFDAK